VGLLELFVAVLVIGVSLVNAGPPVAAWSRSRDVRFLFLAASNVGLALLGAVGAWGQLPYSPPAWAVLQLPVLALLLLVVLLLLVTTVLPRRA
jgi:type II secretory pathway pseudopilin PulG